MNKPLVSVIIPTIRRHTVLDAVRSVEAQTYPNVETVVVIDGSQDGTLEMLEDYKASLPAEQADRLQIIYQDNKGVSAARNTGFGIARGEYLSILDDDDELHPDKIARQMEAVSACPVDNLWICTTDYTLHDVNQATRQGREHPGVTSLKGHLELNRFPATMTWLFPKEVVRQLGGFDEKLTAGEDFDFIIRLRQANATFVHVDDALGIYNYLAPKEGKVYPHQTESAVRTLQKHYGWFKKNYTPQQFEQTMDWYRGDIVLGEKLFNETVTELEKEKDMSEKNTDSKGPMMPSEEPAMWTDDVLIPPTRWDFTTSSAGDALAARERADHEAEQKPAKPNLAKYVR